MFVIPIAGQATLYHHKQESIILKRDQMIHRDFLSKKMDLMYKLLIIQDCMVQYIVKEISI